MYHYQHHTTIVKLKEFCPLHINGEVEIVYPKNESIVVTYDTDQYTVFPGEAILILPYHLHSFSYTSDLDCYIMVFPKELTDSFTARCSNRGTKEVFTLDPCTVNYIDHLIGNFDKNTDDFTDRALFHAFAQQFTQAHQHTDSLKIMPDFLTKALEYINDHLDTDIFLADIAKATGVSSRQFSKFFAETFGIRLFDFIANARIQRAISLLKTTSLSVTEISSLCGFGSLRNFNRIFKSKVGTSPRDYRKKI